MVGVIEDLARARTAYERRAWRTAYDALSGTDDPELAAADFDRLAISAYLVGRANDAIQAGQRGYQLHVANADVDNAVRSAFFLAMTLMQEGENAIGGGWVSRAQRLLEEVSGDTVGHGYVRMLEMFQRIFSGDFAGVHPLAVEVTDYGQRFDDADLHANGLNAQGRMLIYAGRVREGLALLDESMVAVTMGEVSPVYAGDIYCSLIEACQEVSDYGRAAEWTSRLTRWVDEQPELVRFTGQCAVHRGQILRIRGALRDAATEFESAVTRYLAAGEPGPAGLACAEHGDVLRVLGDHAGAEAAYDRAAEFGHEAQPGLALLRLAQGRTEVAAAAVRRLLGERDDPVGRSQVLPAAVEVLLAAGELEAAGAAADELAEIAQSFGCLPMLAMAGDAVGSVLVAREDYPAALAQLRSSVHSWAEADAPYQAARTRVLIGRCVRGLGDEDAAVRELAAAHRSLVALGAQPDAEAVARLLPGAAAPGGLSDREMDVLRLVATGQSNHQIAAALFLSEKTVARHLSNIFTKLDVTSRTAAAAYAFEHRIL